ADPVVVLAQDRLDPSVTTVATDDRVWVSLIPDDPPFGSHWALRNNGLPPIDTDNDGASPFWDFNNPTSPHWPNDLTRNGTVDDLIDESFASTGSYSLDGPGAHVATIGPDPGDPGAPPGGIDHDPALPGTADNGARHTVAYIPPARRP